MLSSPIIWLAAKGMDQAQATLARVIGLIVFNVKFYFVQKKGNVTYFQYIR